MLTNRFAHKLIAYRNLNHSISMKRHQQLTLIIGIPIVIGVLLLQRLDVFSSPQLPVVRASEVPARAADEVPSQKEVLFVIGNSIGNASQADAEMANGLLKTWDERAVPVLRAAALDNAWFSETFRFLCVLQSIESPAAVELLIDLLAEHPRRMWTSPVLETLRWMRTGLSPYWMTAMGASARLEQVVVAYASKADAYEREAIAHCAVTHQWQSAVPTLTEWLQDEDQNVRKESALALRALTGREYKVELAKVQFPREALVPGLLKLGPTLEFAREAVSFPTGAGTWGLAFADSRGFHSTSSTDQVALQNAPLCALPFAAQDMLVWQLDTGEILLVVKGSTTYGKLPKQVVALTTTGSIVWTYQGTGSIGTMRPFLTDRGEPRLAVHDDRQLIALGPDGTVQVDDLELVGVHALLSHPAFPGQFYSTFFGSFECFEFKGERGRKRSKQINPKTYPLEAVLVPDAAGDPLLVFAGNDENSVPVIEACDLSGRQVWSAVLQEPVLSMHSIQSAGDRELLVTMEAGGILSVLDVDGTLLGRIDSKAMEMSNDELAFSVFGSFVNQIAENTYRATFRTTQSHTVVLIDLDPLDSR